MKIVLFALILLWLYSYWRFTGKRSHMRKLVMVTERRFAQLKTQQSAIDLATAYMNAQRYADAYALYAKILSEGCVQAEIIRLNMEFCQKPLPWSKGLKNHSQSYWHNFMLVRLGGRRNNLISQEAILALDNYNITGKFN